MLISQYNLVLRNQLLNYAQVYNKEKDYMIISGTLKEVPNKIQQHSLLKTKRKTTDTGTLINRENHLPFTNSPALINDEIRSKT